MNVNLPHHVRAFLAAITLAFTVSSASAQTSQSPKKPAPNAPAGIPVPNAPQSTHYPILLLGFGEAPSWDVRIGPKGPELLERQGYPPIVLEPGEISREGTTDAWTYRAKDIATGADVSVHLTRETCSASSPAAKSTFRATVMHAQIGALEGCARIAAELFPRVPNQSAQGDDDDAADKKKPPAVPPITNSKPPVSVAYLSAAGRVIFSRNGVRKTVAPAGGQLSLARDGKRLLYTRPEPKPSPLSTIVLYDFDSGHSRDLVNGVVGAAFWSPDDSRIAYLNSVDKKAQVWVLAPEAPERPALFSSQIVATLRGWVDSHTVLATEAQNVYWLSENTPTQTLVLKEIYGDSFQTQASDTLAINPVNPDLLLVSAAYAAAPAGAPADSSGTAYGFFLYEFRSKRRVALSPPDQLAQDAAWSRDGIQVYYTRHTTSSPPAIFRIFWDGSGLRRYAEGSDLVVGQ